MGANVATAIGEFDRLDSFTCLFQPYSASAAVARRAGIRRVLHPGRVALFAIVADPFPGRAPQASAEAGGAPGVVQHQRDRVRLGSLW